MLTCVCIPWQNTAEMQGMMGHAKMQQSHLNSANVMAAGISGKVDEEPSFFTSVDQEAGALSHDNVGLYALLPAPDRPPPHVYALMLTRRRPYFHAHAHAHTHALA